MGSAFHQLCPRYSGTLTPTAPTAIRLWETFTFLPFNDLIGLLSGANTKMSEGNFKYFSSSMALLCFLSVCPR